MIEPEPSNVEVTQAGIDQLVREATLGKRDAVDAFGRQVSMLVSQVAGLWRNTARSVQALDNRLTPAEREQILLAVERGQAAPAAATKELEDALRDLERAAGIIGVAMLRDLPR